MDDMTVTVSELIRKRNSRTENSLKRRHRTLSIKQKVELLQKLESGIPVRQLCVLYDIGSSTIYDAKRQKDEIIRIYENSDNKDILATRKKLKENRNFDAEMELLKWFKLNHDGPVSITGDMIITKAKMMHQDMQVQYDCEYSHGWLQKFKIRHGIKTEHGICFMPKNKENESSTEFELNGSNNSGFENTNNTGETTIISPANLSAVNTFSNDKDKHVLSDVETDNAIRPSDNSNSCHDDILLDDSTTEDKCADEGVTLITNLIECLEKSSLFSELEIMILYMMQERLINRTIKKPKQ